MHGSLLRGVAEWHFRRHAAYSNFVQLIHRVIVAVAIADADERKRRSTINAFLGGPSNILNTTLLLPSPTNTAPLPFSPLLPFITTTHTYLRMQRLYQDIHEFVSQLRFAEASTNDATPWLVLYILFVQSGLLSESRDRPSAPRLSLRVGLSRFVAIFKYIVRTCTTYARVNTDTSFSFKKDINWVKLLQTAPPTNNTLRDVFGIAGHHPTIPLAVLLTPSQRASVSHAITLLRKGKGPRRTLEVVRRACDSAEPSTHIIHRRALNSTACNIFATSTRSFLMPVPSSPPVYTQRLIYCRLCNATNDATTTQLWYHKGFRTLHCRGCKEYFSTFKALCSCGAVWHSCTLHRSDPLTHVPRRAWKRKRRTHAGEPLRQAEHSYPHRSAPVLTPSEPWNMHGGLPKRRIILRASIAPTLARRFPHLVQPEADQEARSVADSDFRAVEGPSG